MNKNAPNTPRQLELAFEKLPTVATPIPVSAPEDTPVPHDRTPPPEDISRGAGILPRVTMKNLAEALRLELERRSGCHIMLTVTNNTTNLMSVAIDPGGGHAKLRLHHMFLDAPEEIRAALVHWIKHPRSRKYADCFRSFIASRNHQIRKPQPAPTRITTNGAVYDLKPIFDELNTSFFNSTIEAAISWGKGASGPMRSIRFGSYYETTRLIRIHPRLDQDFVPFFVVRYIIYHEMLHAHLGIGRTENGRRQIHPRRFKIMESSFPDYRQAVTWIEDPENLNRILRGRRTRRHR